MQSVTNSLQSAITQITDSYSTLQSSFIQPKLDDSLSWLKPFNGSVGELLFWGTVTLTVIVIVLLVSITRKVEAVFDPILFKIKRFAPYIMQVTLAVALIASAHFGALFGPDLLLTDVFGSYGEIIQVMMYVAGLMLLLGIYPRMISFAIVLFALPLVIEHTSHMLTHATYIGEAFTIFAFGGAYHSLQNARTTVTSVTEEIRLHLHKYKFAILRIFLGLSLVASAISSRLFVAAELEVVIANTQIASLFPNPSFFLFGVIILEILFGLFFIIGFEIRFASIAYLAFLLVSISIFQEAIWQYIILIGTPLAMFTHGYDTYTVGGRYFSQGNLEPIL
jgi:uncharacterized membrane protein YphA (DoxX/SURF4 family)